MLAADLGSPDRPWAPAFVVNAPDDAVKPQEPVLQAVRDGRLRDSGFDARWSA